MGDRDDELARTATAPVGTSQPLKPVDPVGSTLGRYKLERELGSGGMGVVHAAFDPDLERRVALKVLREAAGSSDARQRLLREARAMARLNHPNVVTVHEVSSANGRDYVAMEMIEGETLAEWMRAEERPENEIIDAFVAAGRGLAAAHAQGIVHRDFKPHNILRSRTGRIAVTDFGLAREAELTGSADPLAETRELRKPAAGTAVSTSTPSSPLAGLTMTGSVLGTPAYMAPEQWSGGAVTPATDQFAFCVALWEALAGERPFKGPTVERLREEVERGPAELDASKVPRRLRPALMRGLDPDPKKRWPSMEALLAAMSGAERKSKLVYIFAGAALCSIAVVVGLVLKGGGSEPQAAAAPPCREPAQSLDAVWPAGITEKLRTGGQRPAADALDADVRAWRAARERACTVDIAKREPQLACLDGVLARIDTIARGVEQVVGKAHVDVGMLLVDPAVCALDDTPRLATTATPELRKSIAAFLLEESTPGDTPPGKYEPLVEEVKADPCAAVYARYLAMKDAEPDVREAHLAAAVEESERCNDERVRAEFALANAEIALESSVLGTTITSKVRLAELAAKKVTQADVRGALEGLRAEIARRADQLDDAIARIEAAMKLYAERGRVTAEISAALKMLDLKQTRGKPDDLASVAATLDALRARAIDKLGADHDSVRDIERSIGDWQFKNGDVAGATERFMKHYRPEPNIPSQRITGRVVDEKGAPVAGARIAAGRRFGGTAHSIAAGGSDSSRFTESKADGTFEIPDAVEQAVVLAQLGDLRSHPQRGGENLTLVLQPTSTLTGKVDLQGQPHQLITAVAADPDVPDLRYGWPAPVASDGTFTIGGVPRKKLRVFAVIDRNTSRLGPALGVNAKAPKVDNLALSVPLSKRVVHVIVRSTFGASVGNAAVLVMPGKIPSMTARQMRQHTSGINERAARQIEGERAPQPVVKLARSGDLFATMKEVPEGVATACAIALPTDLADPKLGKKIDANLDKLKIECAPIPEGAEALVIEVPPFPRLD